MEIGPPCSFISRVHNYINDIPIPQYCVYTPYISGLQPHRDSVLTTAFVTYYLRYQNKPFLSCINLVEGKNGNELHVQKKQNITSIFTSL